VKELSALTVHYVNEYHDSQLVRLPTVVVEAWNTWALSELVATTPGPNPEP
jgi:hypothetical protein